MTGDEFKALPATPEPAPQPDGFGTLEEARKAAQDAGDRIVAEFGGRPPKESVSAAYQDFMSGMRGIDFYPKHIPNWTKHSHWRRKAEARMLLEAVRARRRRGRKADPLSSDKPGDTSHA